MNLLQTKTIHDDGLIRLPVFVISADVGEDVDLAVSYLHRARVIGRTRHIEFMPGLAGVFGVVDAARGDMEDGSLARREKFRVPAVRKGRGRDVRGRP